MDTTLVVNPGSSSKKYALFRGDTPLLSVTFEHVGEGYGKCVEVNGIRNHCEDIEGSVYNDALHEFLTIAQDTKVIHTIEDISRIGVRIVAPGSFFTTHRMIDSAYRHALHEMCDAAPLHIPHIISELQTIQDRIPQVPLWGISDTAFHTTIPEFARVYSIQSVDTEQFDLHRFGYHGLSIGSIVHSIRSRTGTFPSRVIICHIGSGMSVTALRDGLSRETSMGFSPTSGLMMNTRAGDIDAGALLYLMKKKQFTPQEAETYVTQKGGLMGMLGQSDLRVALDRMNRGDHHAHNTVTLLIHHIRKTIGAYTALLGGLDMVVLTGTAAERNASVRAMICAEMDVLGLSISQERNEMVTTSLGIISTEESRAKIMVTHTDEMGEIARRTQEL